MEISSSISVTLSDQKNSKPDGKEVTVGQNNYLGGIDRSAMMFDTELRDTLTNAYDKLKSQSTTNVFNLTVNMREAYTQVQKDLLANNPELLEKDWDFTVDQNGELLILEGKDKLSKTEMDQIKLALESSEIDLYMNDLATSIVDAGIGARGPEQWADAGFGKYDLTRETLSEIFKGRELMLDTKIYYRDRDPENLKAALKAYNENKLSPIDAIMQQLRSRGVAKYDYDPSA